MYVFVIWITLEADPEPFMDSVFSTQELAEKRKEKLKPIFKDVVWEKFEVDRYIQE